MSNMPNSGIKEILPNGVSFEMVFVEGARFMMENEEKEALDSKKPVYEVTLNSFYIGRYPVTPTEWKACSFEKVQILRHLRTIKLTCFEVNTKSFCRCPSAEVGDRLQAGALQV